MKCAVTVPAELAKRGITGASDNLHAGQGISFAQAFVRIFQPELEQIFLKQKGTQQCAAEQAAGSSRLLSE